jgi:hypothetical protein
MNHWTCFATGFIAGLATTIATVLIVELLGYFDVLTIL